MAKQIDVRVVEPILYSLYKAIHELAGASAPAVMRKSAPDLLDGLRMRGMDFSCVDDIEKLESKLEETLTATGVCDSIDFVLDGDFLTAKIHGCAFSGLTGTLKEKGIEPFGCPFSALTIALAEKNLGKRARIKELHPTEGGGDGDTTMVIELHEK